jgi:hypothetical protein
MFKLLIKRRSQKDKRRPPANVQSSKARILATPVTGLVLNRVDNDGYARLADIRQRGAVAIVVNDELHRAVSRRAEREVSRVRVYVERKGNAAPASSCSRHLGQYTLGRGTRRLRTSAQYDATGRCVADVEFAINASSPAVVCTYIDRYSSDAPASGTETSEESPIVQFVARFCATLASVCGPARMNHSVGGAGESKAHRDDGDAGTEAGDHAKAERALDRRIDGVDREQRETPWARHARARAAAHVTLLERALPWVARFCDGERDK